MTWIKKTVTDPFKRDFFINAALVGDISTRRETLAFEDANGAWEWLYCARDEEVAKRMLPEVVLQSLQPKIVDLEVIEKKIIDELDNEYKQKGDV